MVGIWNQLEEHVGVVNEGVLRVSWNTFLQFSCCPDLAWYLAWKSFSKKVDKNLSVDMGSWLD